MPIVTNENAPLATEELEAYVARVKEGWRAHAASLSWEEKIAAIERMRARSASLREARELIQAKKLQTLAECSELRDATPTPENF